MGLLKPAANQTAYLKAGILGFQGSGKTYTAARMAAGLAKISGGKNPKVAFYDTEKGSDFLVKYFASEKIQFDVAKTRAFKDLIDFMAEVEKEGYDVAIIDSISHVWRELLHSYEARKRRTNGLLFQDWGPIKSEWQQFTDMFINSKLHTIVLGRAGYEYDMSADESGKKELTKTGTKMKAEGEFGYESDLLLEMERIPNEGKGKGWINRCFVLKDRTDTMNGKVIDYPTFNSFKTVLGGLNIGGEHFGVDASRDSESMFTDPDYSYQEVKKQRDIALEEMAEVFTLNGLNGTGKSEVQQKVKLLVEVFGTSSKTALDNMNPDDIRNGVKALRDKLSSTDKESISNTTAENNKKEPF